MTKDQVEAALGKPMNFTKTFKHTGEDFSGLEAAKKFLYAKDLSEGSMERGFPIGLSIKAPYISKWTRMRADEHKQLDGVMVADSFREGDVTVYLAFEVV